VSITGRRESAAQGVFRVRVFAVLFAAETVSVVGSQLAKFALSVLVFERTNSAAAAALTYATSYLPATVGGPVLGRLVDRYSRRAVMITADLLRAALFVAMVTPSLPLGVVVAMLAVAVFLDPSFTAAELSLLADALDGEQFRAATAVRGASAQLLQVAGFAFGGAVVAAVHPRGALLIDAATFAVSALCVRLLVAEPDRGAGSGAAETVADPTPRALRYRGLWGDRRTRVPMAYLVLVALFVLPEALAVPFGHAIGASTVQTGILVAMIPFGSAVGAVLVVRMPPTTRAAAARAMAVACGLPLLASAAEPPWPVALVCWFASGVFGAYMIEQIGVLVAAIPSEERGRRLAHLSSWLTGSQGVAFALAGGLTEFLAPGVAIAGAAGAGCVVAGALTLRVRAANAAT